MLHRPRRLQLRSFLTTMLLTVFVLPVTVPASLAQSALATPTNTYTTLAAAAGDDNIIYDDALASTWQSWSWGTTVEPRSTTVKPHAGSAALAVTFNQAWAGLYLNTARPIATANYDALRFWVHGGNSSDRAVAVWLRDDNNQDSLSVSVEPRAGQWTEVVIPLLDFADFTSVSGVIVQERGGNPQSTFYLDDIALIDSTAIDPAPTPPEQPTPPPTPEPTPPPPTQPPAQAAFLETFDGDPAAPLRWQPKHWDVSIHTREATSTFDRMQAQHGADCGAPPTTHAIDQYEAAVYLCRNHMMTAISASDYGVVYLTPDHLVDFSQGEAVVRFDMSTFRTSGRDWVDLWISPYEDHLQMPLDDWLPDLQGEPRRGIHVRMDNTNDDTMFRVKVINGHESVELPGNYFTGYETFLEPDAKRRDTFELRISETSVKFGMPDYNFWWVDESIAKLDWNRGVVQFGHHSYNPKKACSGCDANTWHWDNVAIEPALPFTIVRADRRVVNDQEGTTVAFPTGAPANAHLRFTGIGGKLQVSYDGGSTWEDAQLQRQEKFDAYHFRSYWMPVPAGVTSVQFRGENQGPELYPGPWMIRDISIWSTTAAQRATTPSAGCLTNAPAETQAVPTTRAAATTTLFLPLLTQIGTADDC